MRDQLAVGIAFSGSGLCHGVDPACGLVVPFRHERGEHGHGRTALQGDVVIDEAAVDQRVEQAVQRQVLRHEQLERVLHHQAVFHVAAQPLPLGRLQPGLLAGVKHLGFGHRQTQAGEVLRDAQVVHGMEHGRCGEGGTEPVGRDRRVVHVRAPRGVAQREQDLQGFFPDRVGNHGHHAALIHELEVGFHRVLLACAGHGPVGVIELARVFEHIPVGELDAAARGVKQLVRRVPGGPVVEVGHRLGAERGLLVTRSGLLVANVFGDVGKGVAQRGDLARLQVDVHRGLSPLEWLSNTHASRRCTRLLAQKASKAASGSISSTASSGQPIENSKLTSPSARRSITRTKRREVSQAGRAGSVLGFMAVVAIVDVLSIAGTVPMEPTVRQKSRYLGEIPRKMANVQCNIHMDTGQLIA
ncbi:hypothetical protein FQZ97_764340 [compost metagenome]